MKAPRFKAPLSAATPEALLALEKVSIRPMRVFGFQRALSKRYATDGYLLIDGDGARNKELMGRLLGKVSKNDPSEKPRIGEDSVRYILPESHPWEDTRARLSAIWRFVDEAQTDERTVHTLARVSRLDGLPAEDYDAEKIKLIADVIVEWDMMSSQDNTLTFWRDGRALAIVMAFRSMNPRLDDPTVTMLGGEGPPPDLSIPGGLWTPTFPDNPPLPEGARKPAQEAWVNDALARIATSLGGGPDHDDPILTRFVVPTRFGTLRFGANRGDQHWWFYSRFDEPRRRLMNDPSFSLTGGWNHPANGPEDLVESAQRLLGDISLPPELRPGPGWSAEPPRSGDRYQTRWIDRRWVLADTERRDEPLLPGAAHDRARILGAAQTVNLSRRLALRVNERLK